MTVLFICVNYNSDQETLRFSGEVLNLPVNCHVDMVVVDNTAITANRDLGASLYGISNKLPKKIYYIRAPRNLGYFGGANYGLSQYLIKNKMPEWVIVSNVDMKISSNDIILKLMRRKYDADVAIIAPSIISGLTGRDQNPMMIHRPRRIRMLFYKYIYSSVVMLNLYEVLSKLKISIKRFNNLNKSESELKMIYAPHGSFIIFNKLYFEKNGNLKFPCFLFGEEIFVAETARSLGLNIVYDPALKVFHDEHSTTGHFRSTKMAHYQFASIKYITDTYFCAESKLRV